jgi:hypothetical protein
MNRAILNDIEHRCNATVTYETGSNGDTTYHVTKQVDGKPVTMTQKISAAFHAAAPASEVSAQVVCRVAKQFAEYRQEKK